MAPRRRCPVCGSRKWHKEPSSGLITCSEGHVLQNYRNETNETTELGVHALTRRREKSGRKKKEKESRADPNLYHGARARFHYFQCLQLLLRKQIETLVRVWELPSEYEVVCRDVWALHLSLLPVPPPAEPFYHTQDRASEAEVPPAKPQGSSLQTPKQTQSADRDSSSSDTERQEKDDSSSSSSSESDDEEEAELAKLMEELSESSTDEEIDNQTASREKDHGERKRKGKGKRQQFGKYDSPASNLSVLVIACWQLRLPVMYMYFVRLIQSYELPYLDPVERNLFPQTMTRHLTKHTVSALSPHRAPDILSLHSLTSRLARLMHTAYGVWTPELNAAPVLWRAVRGLGGSPVLYHLSKIISHTLSLTLTLHHSLVANKLEKARKSDPDHYHKFDNVPPEATLVAAVVVSLRMIYGLDGRERAPETSTDPAFAMPPLHEYLSALKKADKTEARDRSVMFSSQTQINVVDLEDDVLDEYLQFCENALLGDRRGVSDGKMLEQYFPMRTVNSKGESTEDHIEESDDPEMGVPPTGPQQPVKDENRTVGRPCEGYRIYNARDVLGTLPEEYDFVVGRAARWTGVSEECVIAVVERFERRIVRWWDGVKRRERRKSEGGEGE